MGVYQISNDLEEMISGFRSLPEEDNRSVKQMLIDKGEWTEDDEEQLEAIKEIGWDDARQAQGEADERDFNNKDL